LQHEAHAVEEGVAELAGGQGGVRHVSSQCGGVRRGLARVPHAHGGAATRAPARHREAGLAESEHEHRDVLQMIHRNFKLASPTRHNNIVTIQKRTTTCVSFQPDFSKWWCSGAIFRMRRPVPKRFLVNLNQLTCSITDSASATNTPP